MILCRGDPDVLHSISFNRGDLWFLLAILIFALYSPLLRKRPAMHPISFLAVTAIAGTRDRAAAGRVGDCRKPDLPAIDAHRTAVVLYMAIFPSLLAYLCYNRGVQLLGPNPVAALYPLIIVFGSVQAMRSARRTAAMVSLRRNRVHRRRRSARDADGEEETAT